MELVNIIIHNFFSFVLIISLIVFIHEYGHFIVARICNVKVTEFSIGFGKKLFSFYDKKNTEWKFCLLPFGGYVKMYGDRNGASTPDYELIKNMSDEDKKISFISKNVYQRMAIVGAGPIANFILAIIIFTFLFKINGSNKILPIVDEVIKESPASVAGIKQGDEIIAINNKEIKDFDEVRSIIVTGLEEELIFKIKRANDIIEISVKPIIQERTDFLNETVKIRTVGIASSQMFHQELSLYRSFLIANKETYNISVAVLKTLKQLITGKRSVKELGGPIKIAKYSGKTIEQGFQVVIWFMALISINLGIMNLLPIPVLDGGHLFYYIIEAIRGKPLSQKLQQIGFNIGFSLVITLMIFTTINDILNLF
jgi:regulator of sigma E protease